MIKNSLVTDILIQNSLIKEIIFKIVETYNNLTKQIN